MKTILWFVAVVCLLLVVALNESESGANGKSTSDETEGWWLIPKINVPLVGRKIDVDNQFVAEALARFQENSKVRYTGTPEGASKSFLNEYAPYFTGLSPRESSEFRFILNRTIYSESLHYTICMFDIYYHEVRISGAYAYVDVDSLGLISGFRGNHELPELPQTTIPVLSESDALEVIRREVFPRHIDTVKSSELIIYRSEPMRLAHRIELNISEQPGLEPRWNRCITLDAITGDVLSVSAQHIVYNQKYDQDSLIQHQYEKNETVPWKVPSISVPSRGPEKDPPWDSIRNKGKDKPGRVPGGSAGTIDVDSARRRLRQFRELELGAKDQAAICGFAWFTDVTYADSADLDGDGRYRSLRLNMLLGTIQQNLQVYVDIWITDSYDDDVYLGAVYSAGPLSNPDNLQHSLLAPYTEIWDVTLAMFDTDDNFLCGTDFSEDPDLADLSIEHRAEDISIYYPDMGIGEDFDADGAPRYDTLWFIPSLTYDTTMNLTTRVFARRTASPSDSFLYVETRPFEQSLSSSWRGVLVSPGPLSEWDFRIDLVNVDNDDTISGTTFGWYPVWIDTVGTVLEPVPLWTQVTIEHANLDPEVNTVFMPNPISRLNRPLFWDEANSKFAVIDSSMCQGDCGQTICDDTCLTSIPPAYEIVELQNLESPLGGIYWLTGTYVDIQDFFPSFSSAPPPGSPGDATFPAYRNSSNFEAVMCYYWIDWNQDYVKNDLRFNHACDRQIIVDHYGYIPTVPDGDIPDTTQVVGYVIVEGEGDGFGRLYFSDWGTDAAEDADVILHEYAHAIQDHQNPGTFTDTAHVGDVGYGNETFAITEGFSDYWSCSMTLEFGDPGFAPAYHGEWFNRRHPDSGLFVRRVNTDKHYPDDMVDTLIHANGEIWSACLWEMFMHPSIGKRVTDSLVLRANEPDLIQPLSSPIFVDMADAILRADSLHYNGAHWEAIREIFFNRGIDPCGTNKTICSCWCPRQGDVSPLESNGDGIVNVLDVVTLIDEVFRSGPTTIGDPSCPQTRGDMAPLSGPGDGIKNVLDVVFLIDYVFRFGPAPGDPCL